MGIAAALCRKSELELRLLTMGNPRIQIGTIYTCTVSVAALLNNIPYFVLADIFEHKDMAQVCIETFHQNVCLPVPQMGSPVYRTAVTVGTLFTQIVGQFDLDTLTAYCRYVQVLIVCLRSTETGRISQACLKIICRLVEQVDARTENKLVNQVVLVQTGADQHGQYIHFPLILHESTGNADILLHVTMIAGHNVMQGVVLIFQSAGEGSGSKETVVHIAYIHATGNPSQVFRLAVGIHVLLGTIVTVAIGVLDGGVS